jgi:hypothetical protein
MALRSGLGAQFGFVTETVYGTAVTVTKFVEYTSESVNLQRDVIESRGIRAGSQILRTDRFAINKRGAAGDINFDVSTKGFGTLMYQALGAKAAPVVLGSGWQHTITPDMTNGMSGLSMTCQFGRPDTSGTVNPFTYDGVKVTGWEFSNALDGLLNMRLSVDAQTEAIGTPTLAAASYAANDILFNYTQGLCEFGVAGTYGTPVSTDITNFTITGANGLKTDRHFIRNSTDKKEPIRNAFVEITGSLTTEFESVTAYNRFVSGALASVTLTYDTGVSFTGGNYKLVIKMPNVRFDGDTPNASGPDVVMQNLPIRALYDGTNPAIQIDLFTTDATI